MTHPSRKPITTDGAPAPAHTFSQGVMVGDLLQVSGQGPVDPATNEYLFPGDVAAQTTRTLQNVEAIVQAGGGSMADVVMLRVYLTDREDFAAMNDAYGAFLADRIGPDGVLPSRTTVMVGLPRAEMLVEIDALAVVGSTD
jgi:reactive intermediate/imine deaminase